MSTTSTQSLADIKTAITAINARIVRAMREKDAISFSRLATRDGVLMPPHHKTVRGRANLEHYWQETFAQSGLSDAVITTDTVEQIGEAAIEVGTYRLIFDQGGVRSEDVGKYMVLWKFEEGQWRLHYDMFNTSLPRP